MIFYATIMWSLTVVGALGCFGFSFPIKHDWREDALQLSIGFTVGAAIGSVVMTYAAIIG